MSVTLYHVHDPMCSYCWGFRPVLREFIDALPDNVALVHLLGGLAPDSNDPMPMAMQEYLQRTWKHIETAIPGAKFNHDFWDKCQPRRATYPACRAVVAARLQGEEFAEKMTNAIQEAYYLQARNPSDDDTLIALAEEIGLNASSFSEDLNSDQVKQVLEGEITLSRRLGVQGFPSLVLVNNEGATAIPVDYLDAARMGRSLVEKLSR